MLFSWNLACLFTVIKTVTCYKNISFQEDSFVNQFNKSFFYSFSQRQDWNSMLFGILYPFFPFSLISLKRLLTTLFETIRLTFSYHFLLILLLFFLIISSLSIFSSNSYLNTDVYNSFHNQPIIIFLLYASSGWPHLFLSQNLFSPSQNSVVHMPIEHH